MEFTEICQLALPKNPRHYLFPGTFDNLNFMNPGFCWGISGKSSAFVLSLLSPKTWVSLPPEPPLLSLPSCATAQVPVVLVGAVGRGAAREPRGHKGLNRRSVKAGAAAWGVPKIVLSSGWRRGRGGRGGAQPAAEEFIACASARETLSKTRLRTILSSLVSGLTLTPSSTATAYSCGGHSHPLGTVTLWSTAPAGTGCPSPSSHSIPFSLFQPGLRLFSRGTSPTTTALQEHRWARGSCVQSFPQSSR